MGAIAEVVEDPAELARVSELMTAKFKQPRAFPTPEPGNVAILGITPRVISVFDYTRGFGHAESVELDGSRA
jgi:hypothetical protein